MVHGCAFTAPHRESDPLAGFSAPADGRLHLLCLHGEVGQSGTYAPIAPQSLERSGAAYAARYGENDAALKTRLETVRTAAEALTSGQELGLVRDRRLLTAGWESGEVDTLFAAIAAGAAIA